MKPYEEKLVNMSLQGMSLVETVNALSEYLEGLAGELDLAAQHKANPGSTNGTLAQVSNSLHQIAKNLCMTK